MRYVVMRRLIVCSKSRTNCVRYLFELAEMFRCRTPLHRHAQPKPYSSFRLQQESCSFRTYVSPRKFPLDVRESGGFHGNWFIIVRTAVMTLFFCSPRIPIFFTCLQYVVTVGCLFVWCMPHSFSDHKLSKIWWRFWWPVFRPSFTRDVLLLHSARRSGANALFYFGLPKNACVSVYCLQFLQ